MKNDAFLMKIYQSLSQGNPVAISWAALYEDVWTLHYSLIIGIDIKNDEITVANPYGYLETVTIGEFIDRTTYHSYENMPLFFKFGFAFGYFSINTLFEMVDD